MLAGQVAPDRLAGKALFDRVRAKFATFITAEQTMYRERLQRDNIVAVVALLSVLIPVAVMIGVYYAMGRRVVSQASTMLDQQLRLEEQAVELEQQVQEMEIANHDLSAALGDAAVSRATAMREITEREGVMALLDASLSSAPVGFAFYDRDLRFMRINAFAATIAGRPIEEIVGRTIREIVVPEYAILVEITVRQVLESGEPVIDMRVATDVPPGSGQRRELIANYYPVRTPDGTVIGVGSVFLDITEREQLAEEARQLQKMEAVGRLAGGVAHDFNNLLTVIRSYCDLVLLETTNGRPMREELLEIRGAADRAAALARQLLTFSRKQIVVPRVFDLNEVATALEAMLVRTLPAHVKHTLALASDLGPMKADPGQIEQVLMNLAINAADAMPDGGCLTITTENATLAEDYARHHPSVTPGEYVMLAVADTGIGMDSRTLARVFEPFFTTKPPGKGTGLGLSTVYGIVQQNGGHIDVDSQVGRGTTFRVYFPRAEEEISLPRRISGGRSADTRHHGTVLVVEDEPSVRASLVRILERQGYIVLAAGHGGEAMRIAASHPAEIDLVISDLMMPEMSGREFVARFSAARPHTRVLFMSGYADDSVHAVGPRDEHQAFIEKPFTVDQITRKVRQVLELT